MAISCMMSALQEKKKFIEIKEILRGILSMRSTQMSEDPMKENMTGQKCDELLHRITDHNQRAVAYSQGGTNPATHSNTSSTTSPEWCRTGRDWRRQQSGRLGGVGPLRR